VGIPYFNAVNVPLFLAMLFFMGVGPLISWKHSTLKQLRKQFLGPIIVAVVVAILLVWAGIPGFYPILSYSLCVFVFLTILKELHRRKKEPSTFTRTLGAHIIHIGVLVATIGITASMAHKIERDFVLSEGQSYTVGRFQFTLKELSAYQTPSFEELQAVTEIADAKTGEVIATRRPGSRFFFKKKENTSEVSILKLLKGDVYLVLAGLDDSGTKAAMKVYINPLQSFLWVGTGVMLLGLFVILSPRARSQRTQSI
jgi:cytochrome c-type biogenesis protein CcmF